MLIMTDNGKKAGSSENGEEIVHTGSGGAFGGTENISDEAEREMSDEQLDERLENTPSTKEPKRPSY